jgi:hypothetical protein
MPRQQGRPAHCRFRRFSDPDRSGLKFLRGIADAGTVVIELDEEERREIERKVRAATLDALQALGGEGTRQDITERALKDAKFTARERAAAAPETAQPKHATFVEYRVSWALTNLKHDGLVENPRRSVWRLIGVATERAVGPDQSISPERLAELGAMRYRDYLRTPEWRRTRAAALDRADHRCSLDREHPGQIEVHHNTYDRLGAELPSDLVVLCQACHRLHHEASGRPRRPPANSPAEKTALTDLARSSTAGHAEAKSSPSAPPPGVRAPYCGGFSPAPSRSRGGRARQMPSPRLRQQSSRVRRIGENCLRNDAIQNALRSALHPAHCGARSRVEVEVSRRGRWRILSVEGESRDPSGRQTKAQVRRAGGHRVGRRALRRQSSSRLRTRQQMKALVSQRPWHDHVRGRLSHKPKPLYESDNGIFRRPHRGASGGRTGLSATEMAPSEIVALSWMHKKSMTPRVCATASWQRDGWRRRSP